MTVAVFTFGRFNPPTIGHDKLVDVLFKTAYKQKADAFIFTSGSNDPKKNPLPFKTKVKYLKKAYGKKVNVSTDPKIRTVFDILVKLYKDGYSDITMIVGSDRVQEFQSLIGKYNGVEGRHGLYNFNFYEVISAGERDADALDSKDFGTVVSDAEAASASYARYQVEMNDFLAFRTAVSDNLSLSDKEKLFRDVAKGMGTKVSEIEFTEKDKFEDLKNKLEKLKG